MWGKPHILKAVKVKNVRARFRAESGFLDYDGVAMNIPVRTLPIWTSNFEQARIEGICTVAGALNQGGRTFSWPITLYRIRKGVV
jgi:hypothetical protein